MSKYRTEMEGTIRQLKDDISIVNCLEWFEKTTLAKMHLKKNVRSKELNSIHKFHCNLCKKTLFFPSLRDHKQRSWRPKGIEIRKWFKTATNRTEISQKQHWFREFNPISFLKFHLTHVTDNTHSQSPNNGILKKKLMQYSLLNNMYFLVNF